MIIMYHMNYMIIMIITDKILNLIYGQLASNRELHLHASYEILKWALPTSDNYALYRSMYLADILKLESEYQEVCEEFLTGHVSVQMLKDNTARRNEADKTI